MMAFGTNREVIATPFADGRSPARETKLVYAVSGREAVHETLMSQ